MKKIALAALLAASSTSLLSGCAAVAVGAYAYDGVEDEKLKQEFMKEFDAQNFEREKAGLKPKDLCTALKRRNMDWWEDDPVCNPKK